jgi:ubiquinone/menaquinone biosynthesis C-methylase UbiE
MQQHTADPNIANANITSNPSLVTRLDINATYAQFDFHKWVFDHYSFRPGMDVLDVGCGNGAQALKAAELIGPSGSVSALDLSEESIAQLMQQAARYRTLQAEVGDMKQLGYFIRNRFRISAYDLAHSTYSLWYASDHITVLDAMRNALKPNGRLIITTPNAPNSLRELVKRMGRPTPQWDQCTRFGPNVLEPYFRSYFYHVSIHMQKNVLRIHSVEEVLRFLRMTAYYSPEVEPKLVQMIDAEIVACGHFSFEKNNYMIIGEQAIES